MSRHEQQKTPLIYELVDLAILPAALLICAKAVGIAVLNTYLGLEWSIQSVASAVFSVRVVYESASDATLVTSYTNLFMYICILAGCILVAGKSQIFHHRKASPHFVLKLAKFDLLHLLKSSMHIYKEAFVWGIFLILTTVYIVLSAFVSGSTFAWIAGITLVATMAFLWVVVDNIEEDLLFHNYK
ncbi:MAG: hypothetical protein ACOCXT_06010 [Candidatus Dojkabacteria bacterium]